MINPEKDVTGYVCIVEERAVLSSWIWHVM